MTLQTIYLELRNLGLAPSTDLAHKAGDWLLDGEPITPAHVADLLMLEANKQFGPFPTQVVTAAADKHTSQGSRYPTLRGLLDLAKARAKADASDS